MKKHTILCCLLAMLLLMNLSIFAYADGSVTYNENAEKFIFSPGTSHSPTSLFEDFQNVMPGDIRTEQILIKNDQSNNVKIKVYIRSLGAQEQTNEFLSQMNLTVQQNGNSILFDAPADQTAQLTDWVYLGTLYSGGECELLVTLEVPVTMGNEYANTAGYLDWEFGVSEYPVEESDPKPPQTGDDGKVWLWAGMAAVSLVTIVILLPVWKRKEEEE